MVKYLEESLLAMSLPEMPAQQVRFAAMLCRGLCVCVGGGVERVRHAKAQSHNGDVRGRRDALCSTASDVRGCR